MRANGDIDWRYGLHYQQMVHDTFVLLKAENERQGSPLRSGQVMRLATETVEAAGWTNPYW